MLTDNRKDWKLLEPVTVGTINLKNRMVMAPMLTCLATLDGAVTKEMINYYSERARGGIGAIITEYSYIDDSASKARGHQLGVYSDQLLPGLIELVETIKSNGAKAILQICHAGRQTTMACIGMQPVAPSPVPNFGEMPKELSIAEIEEIQDAFANASYRAREAGFDGVEVHGAHGYLMSQFLASYTNRRTDKYGGNLDDRGVFSLETIGKIRKKVGDHFTVGYRLNCADYVQGGITLEEACRFAQMLENESVDYIHVTAGIQESWQYIIQPMYLERATLVHLADRIKKVVEIPVITVGSHNVETAERALREGKADLVAFGRSLIADPGFPNKLISCRIEDIRPCIRGNEGCVSNTSKDHAIRCEVNPAAGREADYKILPATDRKNVVVIGGGIAGMEAARLALIRGHRVTLIEKKDNLGGHLIEASVPEFKESLRRLIKWSINQLNKGDMTIKLKTEATPELIQALKPDVLIVAVGSRFVVPMVQGTDRSFVIMPDDVLLGRKAVGERVLVVGAGIVGCETALHIAKNLKKEVIIVEKEDEVLPGGSFINNATLLENLKGLDVKMYTGWSLEEITEKGVGCTDKKGQQHDLEADTVVLALGLRARRELVEKFIGLAPEVSIIGDCNEARDVYHAFEDAWRAVLNT